MSDFLTSRERVRDIASTVQSDAAQDGVAAFLSGGHATFRLVRYFVATSLIAFALIAVALAYLVPEFWTTSLRAEYEHDNVNFSKLFSNQLWGSDFVPLLQALDGKSPAELKRAPQIPDLHRRVLAILHDTSVFKIKVYDLKGMTVYSTELDQIGEDKGQNAGVVAGLRGQIKSELVHRDHFSALEGEIENRNLMQSYVPQFDPNTGKVTGVFEIYSDATPFLMEIAEKQWYVVSAVVGLLGLLYLALLIIVRRAQGILCQQSVERERAEQALRASEERWKLALEGAGDGVWDWSVDSGEMVFSPRWKAMLGYGVDELKNRLETLHGLIHPDDKSRVIAELQACLNGQSKACSASYRLRCKDGSWKWILARGMVVASDVHSTPLRIVGTITDISGHKRVEDALQFVAQRGWVVGGEQFFPALVEYLGKMLGVDCVMVDRLADDHQSADTIALYHRGNIVPNMRYTLAGTPCENVMGKTLCAYVNGVQALFPQDKLLVEMGLESYIGIPLWDSKGEPLGLIACMDGKPLADATSAQEVLQVIATRAAAEIERMRAEAARGMLEGQLREAQKMEAIGTLAGGIAHDFNNILGAIRGNIALVRSELDAAHPAQVSLAEIDKASARAKRLVQQILAFSRKRQLDLVNQPLRPVVEETLRLLRSTLPAGVKLEARLTDAPVYVRADATQMQQVLLNLCTNAWHALQGGAGEIVVELNELVLDAEGGQRRGGLASGRYARLRVMDNGCGMDRLTQARIFEPFFTTKPFGRGTGLGLAVVHGIIKAHQGAITVESTPSRGSTFEVLLSAVPESCPAEPLVSRTLHSLQGNGQHVLYVDDDEAMVFLVQRILQQRGYRVTGCESGETALLALRNSPGMFSLAITDFNMPGLSGLDFARECRRIEPNLPIVVTSGYITEEQRALILECGVHSIIDKPDTVEELCRIVQHLLKTPSANTPVHDAS